MDTKIEVCAECANYISNDEIGDMPIEKEVAMFTGFSRLKGKYGELSLSATEEGENSFRCECCKTRIFGDKYIYVWG